MSMIHETQNAFDSNPTVDVIGVFLEISKTFDNVWQDVLLFKLKSYGIECGLFSLPVSCIKICREHRVVLNGQTSDWKRFLSDYSSSFVDHTSVFSKVLDINNSRDELTS